MAPDDRRRLVLVGAGSAVFTRGLLADLISADDLGAWDIALVDIDEVALRVAVRLAELMIDACDAGARITVSGHVDRRDALVGADIVVTCVGVGGRDAWLRDHTVCMEHGVFQPVGDSVMPGGISRLLRPVGTSAMPAIWMCQPPPHPSRRWKPTVPEPSTGAVP